MVKFNYLLLRTFSLLSYSWEGGGGPVAAVADLQIVGVVGEACVTAPHRGDLGRRGIRMRRRSRKWRWMQSIQSNLEIHGNFQFKSHRIKHLESE